MRQVSEQLTVLVCVKDDWRILRLLSSLDEQESGPGRIRAVVVTTGREDYGALLGRFSIPVEVVASPEPKLALARNRGLAMVRTPLVLTTDADCVAHPGLASAVISSFDRASMTTAGIGGAIEKWSTSTPTQRHGITINDGQDGLQYLPASPRPYITGACAAFRTEALAAVGGYDEQYAVGEDVDICYRLGKAGWELKVDPSIRIRHEDRTTLGGHFRRFRWYAIDQALLFRIHAERPRGRVYVNPYPWQRMASAARLAARGVACADGEQLQAAAVTSAEAAGVWAGDLIGSVRHRVLYL
jgi:glycosyltransferase involved in cell wall biosynthesis